MVEEIAAPSNYPLRPLPINVVVPIYNSGETIAGTVRSVLNSSLGDLRCEISFFVNELDNSPEEAIKNNDISLAVLNYIFLDGDMVDTPFKSEINELRHLYMEQRGGFQVNIVRRRLRHGLAEVYQRSISSYLKRLWNYAESISETGGEKSVPVKEIDEVETNSILLFLDDDIILKKDTLANIYLNCVENNSLSVGRLNITGIVTPNQELKQVLKTIMACWIEFKEAFGLNVSPPRGATLGALHHNHRLAITEDYADQKIFPQLHGKGKKLYHTDIDTIIAESDIPSNGYFMKRIRRYLEGEIVDFRELKCIQNVLNIYRDRKGNSSYTLQDVADFFRLVEERKISQIIPVGATLLAKKVLYC